VPGGKAALDKMEQYVIEAIRDAGETLYNKRNQIGRTTKRYELFAKFKKLICRK
jgi:hypothetical protein